MKPIITFKTDKIDQFYSAMKSISSHFIEGKIIVTGKYLLICGMSTDRTSMIVMKILETFFTSWNNNSNEPFISGFQIDNLYKILVRFRKHAEIQVKIYERSILEVSGTNNKVKKCYKLKGYDIRTMLNIDLQYIKSTISNVMIDPLLKLEFQPDHFNEILGDCVAFNEHGYFNILANKHHDRVVFDIKSDFGGITSTIYYDIDDMVDGAIYSNCSRKYATDKLRDLMSFRGLTRVITYVGSNYMLVDAIANEVVKKKLGTELMRISFILSSIVI